LPPFAVLTLAEAFGAAFLTTVFFFFAFAICKSYSIPGETSNRRRKALPRWL
jgi:hypothetical protein